MFIWDHTIDPDIWPFRILFAPNDYYTGNLVESWEWPDAQTLIAHLRQDVYWQNKAPTNGRQFNADDVVYHYDRLLGTGSGFTEANFIMGPWAAAFDKITAIDEFTVQYKFKAPTLFLNQGTAYDISSMSMIEAREAVEAGINKFENATGTGAFMLTDFIEASTATYSKNPDYWGYDPRHPENKLPYSDQVKLICIPDASSALAAMRTGKIDYFSGLTWQQSGTLAKSNPEIVQIHFQERGGGAAMRVDREPFTDIRVRQALNLTIDRAAVAASYYGGTVDGKPVSMISPTLTGWAVPFDEWPFKDEYSYNPTRAKELLTEAGYPNGFNTHIDLGSSGDTSFYQMLQAFFQEVSVNMEIRSMDPMALRAFINDKKNEAMAAADLGATHPPNISIGSMKTTQASNPINHNDANYDALADKFTMANSTEEARQIANQCDIYPVERHWHVVVCGTNSYASWQPWLKGYNGENMLWSQGWLWPCLWSEK